MGVGGEVPTFQIGWGGMVGTLPFDSDPEALFCALRPPPGGFGISFYFPFVFLIFGVFGFSVP